MKTKTEINKCPKCGEFAGYNDFFCQNCGTPLVSPERPRTKQSMGQIQVVGIVEIVLGIFNLIIGLFLGLLSYIFPRLIQIEEIQAEINDPIIYEIFDFLNYFLIALVIIIFIYGIAAIYFAVRLLQYKNSGRIGTMVISALSLINFPLGTIFGIAALYILTKPETEALFY